MLLVANYKAKKIRSQSCRCILLMVIFATDSYSSNNDTFGNLAELLILVKFEES